VNLSLDRRPALVAIAGPNGAGKTTFFEAFLESCALRFVNADHLARELHLGPYEAAELAATLRDELAGRRESFAFETVFSDPVGDKVRWLRRAADSGYNVLLFFIGLDTPERSDERVFMRVTQGGHDVPNEKLRARFPRTLANLALAIRELPYVSIYDNSDLAKPFRFVAEYQNGIARRNARFMPKWFRRIDPRES